MKSLIIKIDFFHYSITQMYYCFICALKLWNINICTRCYYGICNGCCILCYKYGRNIYYGIVRCKRCFNTTCILVTLNFLKCFKNKFVKHIFYAQRNLLNRIIFIL